MESSFRLSYRAAAILASSNSERVDIFQRMRSFYDTRSRIVHGAPLKPKHHTDILEYTILRRYIRRLLQGFLSLVEKPTPPYSPSWFKKNLDSAAQDSVMLTALRVTMGMDTGTANADHA
jgi:hypothetical protein